MSEKNEDTPKWVVKFYNWMWVVMQVLIIIAFLALFIWLRIGFDKWYFNWLTK